MDAPKPLSGLLANRYWIEKELGKGGMGAVYLVQDRLEGEKAKALKTLPASLSTPEALERFKVEFETLAKLHHPNLERVYDFEYEGERGLHFFTAEYIPGLDFLAATDGAPISEVVELTVQVCRALAYLHARNIIHFDLKPGNILVTTDSRQVKLIDFGLAGASVTETFGTPGYMAPEIFRDMEVDRRADLYCLGVVLYQAVTGEFPYREATTVSMVRSQLEEQPELPSRFNQKIPRPLEKVILRLLDPEPSKRFGSAQAVIEALNEGLGTEYEIETPATATGYLLTSRMVGRDRELGRLKEAYKTSMDPEASLYRGAPGLTLLLGAAGTGKNRLAMELRWHVQLRGTAFISCSPDEGGGSTFEFLSSIVNRLVALAGPEDPAVKVHGKELADFLLAAEKDGEPRTRDPSPGAPSALFERIVRFFAEASTRHPFVLYVKDLHASGAGPCEFLGLLVRSVNLWRREEGPEDGGGASPRQMILASADEEAWTSAGPSRKLVDDLDTLNLVETVRLRNLSAPETEELVASVIGSEGAAKPLAEALHRELGGNPLSALEAMKFLMEEGVLSYGDRAWRVKEEALDRPGGIPAVSRAYAVRTGQLPASRREVLEVLAVLDEPAGADFLATILARSGGALQKDLVHLIRTAFLSSRPVDGVAHYALPHSRLREVLYEGLASERKRDLHARIASRFEQSGGDAPETWGRTALHWSRAGEGARAREPASRAAKRASRLRLYGEAVRFLRILLEHARDPGERAHTAVDLASALCSRNENREGLEVLEGIEKHVAGDPEQLKRALRVRSRALTGLGEHEKALHVLDAMEEIEKGASPFAMRANILIHLAQYEEARELLEARLSSEDGSEASSSRAAVLDSLAFLYRARGDLPKSLEYQEQVHAICLELDDDSMRFQSADGMGAIHSLLGRYTEALKYGREAVRLATTMEDPQAEATARGNLAMTFTAVGRLRRSLKLFQRANRIAERIGDVHKYGISFFNIANVLDGLGRVHQATGPYLRCIAIAEKVGDRLLVVIARLCFAWHHLLLWDVAEARRILREQARPVNEMDNRFASAMLQELRARAAFHGGDTGAAWEDARKALDTYAALGHIEREADVRLLRGRILLSLGRLDEAASTAQDLLGFAREKLLGCFEAEALALLGEEALEGEWSDEGEASMREGAALFRKLGYRGFRTRVLLKTAELAFRYGREEPGIQNLEAATPLVRDLELEDLSAELEFVRALRVESGPVPAQESLALFESASQAAERADCADLIRRANLAWGAALEARGLTREAGKRYRRVQRLFERMERQLPEAWREQFDRSEAVSRVREKVEEARGDTRAPALPPPGKEEETLPEGIVDSESLGAIASLVKRAGTEEERTRFEDLRSEYTDWFRLQELLFRLGTEHNLDTILTRVLDGAIDFTGAQRGFIILGEHWEDEGRIGKARFAATRNFDREDVRSPESKISRSIASEVGRTGEPVIVQEASLDARFSCVGSVCDLSLRSVACVPLLEPGRVLGVLYLDNRFKPDAFPRSKLALLRALAQQAAQAIARSRLYRGVVRERRHVEDLNAKLKELNRELQERLNTQVVEIGKIRRELEEKGAELGLRVRFDDIVGRSPVMQELFGLLDRVAGTDLAVLITGPTGSGKDLVARTIHRQSRRRDGPLVIENCAAIPESLLESELFGFVEGAFTDARQDRAGLLEQAQGGTLFLDEIGEMSPGMQTKLLRVLEQKEVRRVGGSELIPLDLRLLTATNIDLDRAVREGRFREDLYYRLNAFTLAIPSLKKRREDIPLLIDHFLEYFAELRGIEKPELPPRLAQALLNHSWPGNVRELKNEVERLIALAGSGSPRFEDLSPNIRKRAEGIPAKKTLLSPDTDFDDAVAVYEIELLRRALHENEWNVVKTAKSLGINRMKLARKIKKYGLEEGEVKKQPGL